jgi:formylmethanofuran dehydrogenase subunit E
MSWTNDPVADFLAYDAQQAAKLDKLPKCDECGEPIQDEEFYEILGYNFCPDCLESFKKRTEDYI